MPTGRSAGSIGKRPARHRGCQTLLQALRRRAAAPAPPGLVRIDRNCPMTKHCRELVIACTLAALLSATAVAAEPTCPDVESARQEARIATTYDLNPYLRDADIRVSVRNGKATLRGVADSDVGRALAGEIARGVDGIERVDNRIAVDAGGARSRGEAIDDASISASIKFKLLWSKQADGLGIMVASQRGRVTLSGSVRSVEAKTAAGLVAAGTRGVESVDNLLLVDPASVPVAAAPTRNEGQGLEGWDERQDLADAWITTKVRSTYLFSRHLDGADIVVRTEGGVVTLTGTVRNRGERALAIELAQSVRGVEGVVSAGLRP
jgi:hyperosmotically inducible periplasmic protein